MSVDGGRPRKNVPIEPNVHPTTNQRAAVTGRFAMGAHSSLVATDASLTFVLAVSGLMGS